MNYDIFQCVFGEIGGRASDFVSDSQKLFMIALGFENIASERSFYRMKEHNLVTEEQFFDFSSSYFDWNQHDPNRTYHPKRKRAGQTEAKESTYSSACSCLLISCG